MNPLGVDDFWCVSDTHFFHYNIVRFQGRDKQIALLEPDRSIDHNEYMVERWNAVVGVNDPILHLGDLYFWRNNGPERFSRDVSPRLNGNKFLIIGNHDKDKSRVYEMEGFKVVEPFSMKAHGRRLSFDHYPRSIHEEFDGLHIHGHIHLNGYPIGKGREGWKQGTTPSAPQQINVSVEAMDYTPKKLSELVRP